MVYIPEPTIKAEFSLFGYIFVTSLKSTWEQKANTDALTNTAAIKVFSNIERIAKFKARLTSPIVTCFVVLPLTGGLIGVGSMIANYVLCAFSGGLAGFIIRNNLNGFLPNISLAYHEQASQAHNILDQLRASGTVF